MNRSAEAADLRLVPLALGAWSGAWAGLGGHLGLLIAMAAVASVALLASPVRRRPRWAAVAVVLIVAALAGWGVRHRLTTGPVAELAAQEAVVQAVIVPTADPQVRPASGAKPPYLTVRGRLIELSGRGRRWRVRSPVLVVANGPAVARWREMPVGTTVAVSARLQAPVSGVDLAAVVSARGSPRLVARPGAGFRLVERVRAGLRAAVAHRRAEQRGLVPALVLGDTSATSTELTEDFRITGLAHLAAVSGANLTLLLAFVLFLGRWAGVRGWWLRGVGLLGVGVFVALCRTEPSVLRAAAMGLVALAALGTGGARSGLRPLAVATAALVLADPALSHSLGFTLSVLASGGIVWWARRWSAALGTWLPRLVAEAVAVPLAASVATLPVVASIAGTVSVVGLLANALAGPFVGPATVLGFLAAGLSLVSAPLAAVAGFGAAWSAQPIVWVARLGAELPGASYRWPVAPAALVVLAALAVAVGLAMVALLRRRWLVLVCVALLVGCLGTVPRQPGWPPPGWVLVACDVGQGDGLVVRVADRQAIVVDVGPDPVAIRRCLDRLGVDQVPLVVLTHFHADHVDGLTGVLANRSVGEIWTSPLHSPPGQVGSVEDLARAAGVPVRSPSVGQVVTAGETSWAVLGPLVPGPTGPEGEESAVENDASLVIMLTVRGVHILLTGDIEPPGQQALLASGTDLRADVVKLPHHGSSHVAPAFLAATQARVAIASAGLHNDYGHPAPRTVSLVHSLGMTLLRTDTEGSAAIVVRDGTLAAVTERAP